MALSGTLFCFLPNLFGAPRLWIEKGYLHCRGFSEHFHLPLYDIGEIRLLEMEEYTHKIYLETKAGSYFSIKLSTLFFDAEQVHAFLNSLSKQCGVPWETVSTVKLIEKISSEGDGVGFTSIFGGIRELTGLSGSNLFHWILRRALFIKYDPAVSKEPSKYWLTNTYTLASFFALMAAYTAVARFWWAATALALLATIVTLLSTNAAFLALLHHYQRSKALQTELDAAAEVQKALLPGRIPKLFGLEVSCAFKAARWVGGDYYDYFPLPGNRHAFVVADVSGKGISAGLVMTYTKGVLATVLEDTVDLGAAMVKLNRMLKHNIPKNTFISMGLAIVDLSSWEISMVRAGHTPPLFLPAETGRPVWKKLRGIALGLGPTELFEKHLQVAVFPINSGDAMLLYTDGLTEAFNPAGEEFGEARLSEFMERRKQMSSDRFTEALLHEVDIFRAGEEVNDDLTFIYLKWH